MPTEDQRIELGQKVRDTLTGDTGTAIGRTEWLYGCVRITIQPGLDKEGKPRDAYSIDEPQCEVIDAKAARKAAPRHGPRPDVSRGR